MELHLNILPTTIIWPGFKKPVRRSVERLTWKLLLQFEKGKKAEREIVQQHAENSVFTCVDDNP